MVAGPVAQLVDAAKTYPGAVPVLALRPVTIDVHSGELFGIVGPSGSGKSTLLNILGLLDRPTSGRVVVGGVDTVDLADDDLARLRAEHIGYVFQAFHLLNRRSALENVTLGLLYAGVRPKDRAGRARTALERVGLAHRMESHARLLSGGERQRLAVARALAAEPSFLLCDEPTGNLDSRNAASILELLGSLVGEGATVVVVTHAAEVVAACNRIVQVHDGVVHG